MESLWRATEKMPEFPALESDTKTDVLIIGGGMAGLLTAYALTKAGAEVLLIERDELCGGVTGNTTAKLTAQHGLIYHRIAKQFSWTEARMYWEIQTAAMEKFRQLSERFPCDMETKDAWVYARRPLPEMEREMETLDTLKIPAEYERIVPLPFETAGAIRFPAQAQFHPLKFAAGIAQGLNIRTHTAALSFEGRTVHTNRGTIRAEQIVIATHFPMLNKHGAYFLKLYQDRSYVLALENVKAPDGMYRDAEPGGLSLRNWGKLLLLGGGGHRTGKPSDGWRGLEKAATQYYPLSKEKYRWATQDCMTLDGLPYIGQYGRHTPGVYVATGFNKWGMTSAMTAAAALSDLLTGRQSEYAELFSPQRTILRPQLLRNAAEAVKSLCTFRKPRCPHMGCALQWNPQEHSWDCPCHGSRFTGEGRLLNNPANGDMDLPKKLQ
ncbi:MAG: FAD-dependent oxidoreductase [Clostridia bacterium]|nr:FAD-dependent oxidoreductase [Clostridia bacterium]